MTPQRQLILDVVASIPGHLSADQVYQQVVRVFPEVNISTVYRTLDLLVSMGIASSRVDDDGESTYVFCTTAHHHHAICRRCGRVEEVDCGAMEPPPPRHVLRESNALV